LRARTRFPRATAQDEGAWNTPVLHQYSLRGTRRAAPRTPTLVPLAVCLTVKSVGEPDAGNRHVRFDERGWETERCRMAQATAPILDSTYPGESTRRASRLAHAWLCLCLRYNRS